MFGHFSTLRVTRIKIDFHCRDTVSQVSEHGILARRFVKCLMWLELIHG